MKVAFSRSVVVAAIAALMAAGGSTAAWAACPTSPNYPTDFSSELQPTCLTVNNNATIFAGATAVLRLTDSTIPANAGNQTGSAWYNTAQPVQQGFTTIFHFQFTNPSNPPADGIAFVIQNVQTSPLKAIGFTGGNGGALGYGDDDANPNPSAGEGIPNSLAIEFDTYQNSWDPPANGSGSVSHVAIQSCGTGPNTSHHGYRCGGDSGPNSTIAPPVVVPNLADGAKHTVAITYTPACPTCSPATMANIRVILDKVDIFGAVQTDLSAIGLTQPANTAYVGFTGSTGGAYETQDILDWTLELMAQSGVASTNTPALLSFNGGVGNNNTGYDYTAQLFSPIQTALTSTTVNVQPILISEEACEKLVDANPAFGKAQCFVFENADGKGTTSAVLYELTCPDLSGGSCDDPNFFADLGADFVFRKSDNPGFQLLNSTIGPYAGWLKGNGGVAGHPCAIDPNNPPPFLFQSNQISAFTVTGDPTGTTRGKGTPGGSCWVATFATGGELPPGVKITIPAFTSYKQNQVVTANYTCSNPKTSKNPASSIVGPYLTVASCSQSQAPNPNNLTQNPGCNPGSACSGGVDTSVKGLHVFTVTSKDTGGNVGASVVIYNVTK